MLGLYQQEVAFIAKRIYLKSRLKNSVQEE